MTVREKYNLMNGNEIIYKIVNEILLSTNPSLLITRIDTQCQQSNNENNESE